MVPPAAASFMRGLLQRDPSLRLGAESRGGFEELQAHPFFMGLDWDAVYQRRVKPEFVPHVRATDDTSNFDDVFTREAAVDSRSSLDGPGSAGGGGGLFSFFRKKKKKKTPAQPGGTLSSSARSNDGFRGFSYVAPGLESEDVYASGLRRSLEMEEQAGLAAVEEG